MSFKRFLNSHFVFGNKNHISFLQGSSFRFAVIKSLFSPSSYSNKKGKSFENKLVFKAFSLFMPLSSSS